MRRPALLPRMSGIVQNKLFPNARMQRIFIRADSMNNTPKDGPLSSLPFLVGEPSGPGWQEPVDVDAGRLLDRLLVRLQLADDVALAQRLQVTPPIIKMIREEKLAVSPLVMLRWAHTTTGIALDELRELAQGRQDGA